MKRTITDYKVMIAKAQFALNRQLSGGERRDLLKDNTSLSSEEVRLIVEACDGYPILVLTNEMGDV